VIGTSGLQRYWHYWITSYVGWLYWMASIPTGVDQRLLRNFKDLWFVSGVVSKGWRDECRVKVTTNFNKPNRLSLIFD
jgi:hypothetical protein